MLSYLSFDELLSVRLACRDLALLATVDTLPQSYWRSRFLLGQEADFLFPSLTDTRDWCRLFFGIRASLSAGLLPLVNRKRIRQLLEPIAALVDLDLVFNGPYGSVFHPSQSQGSHFQLMDGERSEKPCRLVELAGSFSGQLASIDSDSPLGEGCRVLYYRAQSLVLPCQRHQQRIGISTVQIGARKFISGIKLVASGECVVGRRVGYHNPASEEWIEITFTSHIKALGVTFSSEGLTGIKFVFTNSDSSGWVGDSDSLGVAHGTLTIPEKMNRYFLLAGLDRFKIVSLGVGELTDHPGASLEFPSQRLMDTSRVHSHLWTPHPLRHKNLEISILLPSQPSRAFEPLTIIDFGGPRGLLLGSLARLVFHMASRAHPLIGIEISYSDGRPVLFGSNGGCEISFFIAGSKGERINRIGILEDNGVYHPGICLVGLRVSTNFG